MPTCAWVSMYKKVCVVCSALSRICSAALGRTAPVTSCESSTEACHWWMRPRLGVGAEWEVCRADVTFGYIRPSWQRLGPGALACFAAGLPQANQITREVGVDCYFELQARWLFFLLKFLQLATNYEPPNCCDCTRIHLFGTSFRNNPWYVE